MNRVRWITWWLAAVAAIALSHRSLTASAGDWPQWRGPRGDGTSDETGLPIRWSQSEGVAWQTELPGWGTSTPAISGDAIFLTAHRDDRDLLVLKIDKPTGEIVWTRQVGTGTAARMPLRKKDGGERQQQKFHKLQNMASPSPVTDGQIVVVHFGSGDLAASDFAGHQLWHRNLQEDHGRYTIWWGHANSPIIHEDLVISVCMQDSLADLNDTLTPSYVVAHDLQTGELRWQTMRMTDAVSEECDSYTTPLVCRVDQHWEMVIVGADTIDAYDPSTGRQLWFLTGLAKARTITGPTIGHGRVFATRGMKGQMLAVPLGGRGEVSAESVAWRYSEGTPDSSTPVLWDDLLFMVSDDGIARCLDAHTGHMYWRQRLSGNYKASPIAAEGKIFFLSMEGRTTVVAAEKQYEELSVNPLEGEFLASPAVSDGRIYLRDRDTLYCIGGD